MPRISPLTSAELCKLPCPYCGRSVANSAEWVHAAQASWGNAGVRLLDDGVLAGVLAFGPGEQPKQAVVKALWVHADQVGHGYGRQLIQAGAAELLRHRVETLLAVGGNGHSSCATPPRDFLAAVGFTKPPGEALWRLELRRAVLERTLGPLSGLLRAFGSSGAGPEPVAGAISGCTTESGTP
jgi:hypothetical protein